MKLLSTRQLGLAALYAAIFPISNVAGGGIAMAGIFATLPFLPLAWVGGVALAWLFGTEQVYLVGAAFGRL